MRSAEFSEPIRRSESAEARAASGGPVTGHRSPVTPSSSSPTITLHLRSGKDHPVRLGHPWIFSGAIKDLDPGVEPGSIVRVQAADGSLLGVGYVNPRCDIAVRMLTRTRRADRRRVRPAAASRRRWRCARTVVGADTTAYRLINGEGDGLPGVLVDRCRATWTARASSCSASPPAPSA